MSVKFQIKRGPKDRLDSAERVLGCWYLTSDTNELYVCNDGETLSPIVSGGIATYSSIHHLPRVGNEHIVYFIVDNSGTAIYRYFDNGYKKVLDSTLTIEVIHGGTAKNPVT